MAKSKRKAKQKPVTIKDVTKCAGILSAMYHRSKEMLELHEKQFRTSDNLVDKSDYELDMLRRIGLFQATRIELLDILRLMYMAERGKK